jgi:formate-dependent nitrite reductase membrane component NrfD
VIVEEMIVVAVVVVVVLKIQKEKEKEKKKMKLMDTALALMMLLIHAQSVTKFWEKAEHVKFKFDLNEFIISFQILFLFYYILIAFKIGIYLYNYLVYNN